MTDSASQFGVSRTTGLVLLVIVVCAAGYLVVPWRTYLLSTVFVLATATALLVTETISTDRTLPIPVRVELPRWLLFAVGVVGMFILGMKATSSVQLDTLVYVALIVIPGSFLVSLLARLVHTSASPTRYTVSVWYLGAVLLVAVTIGAALSLVHLSPYETALFGTFLMVVFYLAVIVPIGFWEIGMTSDPPDLESPVPEISVVIPAYNEEEWIGQCIESVLATDYPADKREIIVVDDGSDDATYEQALQYSDRGVRVRRRANGGRDAALNYGLYCSNGDIFVMVDADSLLTELSLKRIAGALQSDPDLGAVAGDVRVLNTDCLLTKIQAVEYMFSIHTFRRACSFFDAVPICPGAVSGFRREAIDNVHGFDPDTVTEDFDTTVQVLKDGWTVRQVDGVVHTEAPFTLADLYTQRVRWYTGCLQNLVKHRDVFVAAESTYLHRFTFPVVAISYLLRPLVGLLTPVFLLYGLFVSHWAVGLVSIAYFIIVIGIVVAATLYLLDEPLYLVPWVIPFLIGYKQFIDFVFIRCIVGYLFGVDVEWGTIQRDARPEVEA